MVLLLEDTLISLIPSFLWKKNSKGALVAYLSTGVNEHYILSEPGANLVSSFYLFLTLRHDRLLEEGIMMNIETLNNNVEKMDSHYGLMETWFKHPATRAVHLEMTH